MYSTNNVFTQKWNKSLQLNKKLQNNWQSNSCGVLIAMKKLLNCRSRTASDSDEMQKKVDSQISYSKKHSINGIFQRI